mgnify:CR=1 FL=1
MDRFLYILVVSPTSNITFCIIICFFVGLILVLRNSILSLKQPHPNLLELRKQPVYCWLAAFFIACLSLLLLITSLKTTALRTLTCQHFINNLSSNLETNKKKSTNCQLVSANLIGNIQNRISIINLQKAKLEKRLNPTYGVSVPYDYKVVLLTKKDQIPFTINWGSDLDTDDYRYVVRVRKNRTISERKLKSNKSLINISKITNSLFKLNLKKIFATRHDVINHVNDFINNSTNYKIIIQDNLLLGVYAVFILGFILAIASILILILAPKTLYKFSLEDKNLTCKSWILGIEKTI